jgi:hypothetical protein
LFYVRAAGGRFGDEDNVAPGFFALNDPESSNQAQSFLKRGLYHGWSSISPSSHSRATGALTYVNVPASLAMVHSQHPGGAPKRQQPSFFLGKDLIEFRDPEIGLRGHPVGDKAGKGPAFFCTIQKPLDVEWFSAHGVPSPTFVRKRKDIRAPCCKGLRAF